MKKILVIILLSRFAGATEFLCWKNGNIPAMAFEVFVGKCDGSKDVKIAEAEGQRPVACVTPA